MKNLDKLMFRREQLPIVLEEAVGYNGKKYWDFGRIELPPHHPSMVKDGIAFESVPELIYEAVDSTIKDLAEVADKREDVQTMLQDIIKDKKPKVVEQDELGIKIASIPIVGEIYIGRDNINPYGYNGDQGISIYPEQATKSFMVPIEVIFDEELMKEYDMEEGWSLFRKKQIKCPNLWYRHNLGRTSAIFYKNLIMALDNGVVKKKYTCD